MFSRSPHKVFVGRTVKNPDHRFTLTDRQELVRASRHLPRRGIGARKGLFDVIRDRVHERGHAALIAQFEGRVQREFGGLHVVLGQWGPVAPRAARSLFS